MMRRFLLFCQVALLMISAASAATQTRVALVSGDQNAANAALLALVTAKLTANSRVALVERTEIDKIIAEQKLDAAQLADSQGALAFGKLLGSEMFVLLEGDASREGLGLVIYSVESGRRLWDTVLGKADMERLTSDVCAGVDEALKKLQRGPGGLKTVAVLPVKSTGLPRSDDSACNAVGLLLDRSLLLCPNLCSLERRRLGQIVDERNLVASVGEELLGAAYLVGIEVRPQEKVGTGIIASVKVTTVAGQSVAEFKVSRPDTAPGPIVENILKQVLAALESSQTDSAFKPKLEASLFAAESDRLMLQNRAEDGLAAIDAALALSPNSEYVEKRAQYQLKAAESLLQSLGQREDLTRVLNLVQNAREVLSEKHAAEYARAEKEVRHIVVNRMTTTDRGECPEFKELVRFFERPAVESKSPATTVSGGLSEQIDRALADFQTSKDTMRICNELRDLTCGLGPAPPVGSAEVSTIRVGESLIKARPGAQETTQSASTMNARHGSIASVEEMTFLAQHTNCIVRLYGMIGLLKLEVANGALSEDAFRDRYSALKKELADVMKLAQKHQDLHPGIWHVLNCDLCICIGFDLLQSFSHDNNWFMKEVVSLMDLAQQQAGWKGLFFDLRIRGYSWDVNIGRIITVSQKTWHWRRDGG